jgi:hypothetical protein
MVASLTRGLVNQEGSDRRDIPNSKGIAPSFTIEAK